ncbi:unnamed protein product, partial [Vitis vinifera]
MSSEKEKGGASHASSAASTASKPNKYSFIPDNFSTIEQGGNKIIQIDSWR